MHLLHLAQRNHKRVDIATFQRGKNDCVVADRVGVWDIFFNEPQRPRAPLRVARPEDTYLDV